MEVSIIGGGLAGLCAAWELSSNPEFAITVFEAGSRPGGKIHASPFAGTIVDEGADAFLRRVPEALQLCAELGIDELVSPATSSVAFDKNTTYRPFALTEASYDAPFAAQLL